ncbi:MAG: hypothetical protein JNL77_03165 [Nitrosomonas sp.]|nr:hypothetical protein [Nitrosomonas sp.]
MENETKEKKQVSGLPKHIASAGGVCYCGYATSLMDRHGEVVLIGKDMNELIQRWYSITDALLDIEQVHPVSIFHEMDVKLKD